MLKKLLIIIIFFASILYSYGQIEDAWIYFDNKPNQAAFISAPLTMLSQRALDRRTRYGIALDYNDVPIEASYYTQIKNATGITVLAKSKWLNALHVQGTKENVDNLLNMSFVTSIEYANKLLNKDGKVKKNSRVNRTKNLKEVMTDFNYGNAANQIQMLNGQVLHQNNYSGQGMQIAVMDAGFPNVDTFAAFERIRDNDQILGGYDFVNRNSNFYTGSSHGTSVLSTMAGYIDQEFIGTAPDAGFYLFITENAPVEVVLEESLWVEAAEKADSLGVDVLNTSLGYSSFFDNANHNYQYSDMNGQTAFITRGAEIAFTRGMILVNSAGNEGNYPWHYMNAPADGPSVFTVGAVDATGTIASFSSYGPTSDGRVKPDVCAQGAGVYVINSAGSVATSNGTSFSSPVLAGVIACFWQAFPNKTNIEITQLIRESAHLYSNPTTQEGYGIPDFHSLYNVLIFSDIVEGFKVYPNPAEDVISFSFPNDSDSIDITVFNMVGLNVYSDKLFRSDPTTSISHLADGLYMVQLTSGNKVKKFKMLKN